MQGMFYSRFTQLVCLIISSNRRILDVVILNGNTKLENQRLREISLHNIVV